MTPSLLRFDMRTPAFSPSPPADMYAAALDMAVFVEEQGFLGVSVSEHHLAGDGYLPSPLVMAGALAGRTRTLPIWIFALIVPLHDPLRVAEDLAVLDLLSGGRVVTCAGIGYRPEEYAVLGKDYSRRGALLDEALEVILAAWGDEPFEYRGQSVEVLPKPATQPRPQLLVAGASAAAARRAARFGLPFAPQVHEDGINAVYEEECARLGVVGGFVLDPVGARTLFVTRDPDRTWQELGRYMLHDQRSYAAWAQTGMANAVTVAADTVDDLKRQDAFLVLTPEETLAYAAEHPGVSFLHYPLVGGAPPEHGWRSLELFADEVQPHLGL